MAAGGHFGWPKIIFDRISRHFRSIRNFWFFFSQNGCRRPFWMTENHFRLHFSPFWKSDLAHFGWPKITFDRISRHFRSIHNFFFLNLFSKWPLAAILEVRFAPKTIGFFHYVLSMAMPNMKLIGEFMTPFNRDATSFLSIFIQNGRHRPFLFSDWCKNHRVLVIWDFNGYGEYEFYWCICDKVMACASVGMRRRRRWRWRRRRRNQKHNITEIFKFRGYNYTST